MRPLTLIAVLALAGCATAEHVNLDGTPAEQATQAGCDPLPLCTVPPDASSIQLTSALWACVLEYRGLYAKCYHLAHPAKTTAIAVRDYCGSQAQGARYRPRRCYMAASSMTNTGGNA